MTIKSLKLIHFRNYDSLDIEFHPRFNVIYGNNGHGKTNILESLFLCSTGRSHRTSKEKEMIQFQQENFCVRLEIEKKDIHFTLEYLFTNGKKHLQVNEVPLDKLSKLMGNLVVVLFSPEDMALVREEPAHRRRFLDITISQMKPAYFYALQQYKKVLVQRNTLLKDWKKIQNPQQMIDVWDQQIVKYGVKILTERTQFLHKLEEIIKPKHAYLTDQKEEIQLRYRSSISLPEEKSMHELETYYLDVLKSNLSQDQDRCFTEKGPHRDDFDIFINGIKVRNFASQGQQRTTLLSIKLAEIELIKQTIGEEPVLLLDDFASELDLNRHEKFMKSLGNMQILLTSTDQNILKSFLKKEDIKYFFIQNGQCT